MKTLALAMLIPVAICAGCGSNDGSSTTTAPAPVDETVTAPPGGGASVPAPPAAVADPVSPPVQAPATAHAALTSAAGNSAQGAFTVVNQGSAVSIRGEITGLGAGKEYGFHIHEVGECSLPDFMSAGGHFNPTEDPHGSPESTARHLGDLPNAKADKDGRALINVDVQGVTLMDKDGAPTEILGKAIVVHAMPDDYKTQPSGGSGARIACGVIR